MKATFNPSKKQKFTASHRKEGRVKFEQYSIISPNEDASERITARIYWPGTRVYACIRIHSPEISAKGSGWAGGGGYCKASASLAEAIENAGFTLSENISGVGERAMESALLAIAESIGVFQPRVIRAHQ